MPGGKYLVWLSPLGCWGIAMATDEANGLLLCISMPRRSIPLREKTRIMLNFEVKGQRKGGVPFSEV